MTIETINDQQLEQATQLALSMARQYRGVDVTDLDGDYLLALAEFANLLAEFDDAIGVEPDPAEPVTRCVYCDEGIGIIHYGDGDRWQPTPALGDDFCENRWDEAPDKPAMYCEESIARESGEFRHSPTEV